MYCAEVVNVLSTQPKLLELRCGLHKYVNVSDDDFCLSPNMFDYHKKLS